MDHAIFGKLILNNGSFYTDYLNIEQLYSVTVCYMVSFKQESTLFLNVLFYINYLLSDSPVGTDYERGVSPTLSSPRVSLKSIKAAKLHHHYKGK